MHDYIDIVPAQRLERVNVHSLLRPHFALILHLTVGSQRRPLHHIPIQSTQSTLASLEPCVTPPIWPETQLTLFRRLMSQPSTPLRHPASICSNSLILLVFTNSARPSLLRRGFFCVVHGIPTTSIVEISLRVHCCFPTAFWKGVILTEWNCFDAPDFPFQPCLLLSRIRRTPNFLPLRFA